MKVGDEQPVRSTTCIHSKLSGANNSLNGHTIQVNRVRQRVQRDAACGT